MEPKWTLDNYRDFIQAIIDEDVWPTKEEYEQEFRSEGPANVKIRAAFSIRATWDKTKFEHLPNRGFRQFDGWDVYEKFLPSRIGTYFHEHYMERRWNFRLSDRFVPYDGLFSAYGAENLDDILWQSKAIWDRNPHSFIWDPPRYLFHVLERWEARFKPKSGLIAVPVSPLESIIERYDRAVTSHQRRLLSGSPNPFHICARCMEDFFTEKRLNEHLGQSGDCSIFIMHHS